MKPIELDNKITRVYLWKITQDEVIQYDKNEPQLNGGYGYHGCDVSPCDAEYVFNADGWCAEYGDYLVATEGEKAPEMEDGWSVEPATLDVGHFDQDGLHRFCVMAEIGGNEYEIAVVFGH